jgi:hypothetical protein
VARRVSDLENLMNEEAIARVGLQSHTKKVVYADIKMHEMISFKKTSVAFLPRCYTTHIVQKFKT